MHKEDGASLGTWSLFQRKQFKSGIIDQEYKERLENLGVAMEVKEKQVRKDAKNWISVVEKERDWLKAMNDFKKDVEEKAQRKIDELRNSFCNVQENLLGNYNEAAEEVESLQMTINNLEKELANMESKSDIRIKIIAKILISMKFNLDPNTSRKMMDVLV